MKIKSILGTVLTVLLCAGLIVLGFSGGCSLSALQRQTLRLLFIVCGAAALYCFVVGEISRNNSQMDKLWSLLPEVYLWITAVKGHMEPRLVIMAVIATLWGARLTMNFARKGAYSIRFWSGEEDYRWVILRKNRFLHTKAAWALFDLLFISVYQNFVVLAITLPAVAAMGSGRPIGGMDIAAALLALGFLALETVADEQQWRFHSEKRRLLKDGSPLSSLPLPYRLGFNTTGIWSCSRHPNYLGEQMIWVSMYLFTIGAAVSGRGIFNWSILGSMLLVLLFLGSSAFGEGVSASKYPAYQDYCSRVSKYIPIPWKKY